MTRTIHDEFPTNAEVVDYMELYLPGIRREAEREYLPAKRLMYTYWAMLWALNNHAPNDMCRFLIMITNEAIEQYEISKGIRPAKEK